MDTLNAMRLLLEVVRHGGFSAAARHVGLATSSLTRRIDALEDHLDAKLLTRTTRSVGLTEAGRIYLAHAARIVDDVDAASRAVADVTAAPRGLLRVGAPLSLGRSYLAALLGPFLNRHPEMAVDLALSDRVVDLAEEGIDIAVRIAPPIESSHSIVRVLSPMRRVVCAAPAYLKRFGAPAAPGDLQSHACLQFRFHDGGDLWAAGSSFWQFHSAGERYDVPVAVRVSSGDADALITAAVTGCGIVMMPDWLVAREIGQGVLVPLLADYRAGPPEPEKSLHLVYPVNRRGSPKVRAFVDYLVGCLAEFDRTRPG